MTSLPDISNVRATYVVQTRRRMAQTISELQAVLRFGIGDGDIDSVIHQMDEQAEASRQAGLEAISRLCEYVRESLAELHHGKRPSSYSIKLSALDACRNIRQHATLVVRMACTKSQQSECQEGETVVNTALAVLQISNCCREF